MSTLSPNMNHGRSTVCVKNRYRVITVKVGIPCEPPSGAHGHILIGNPMNISWPGASSTLRRTRDVGGGIWLEPSMPDVE
jgi:hypothetical protein